MGIESYKRGLVSISLVSAIALSLVITVTRVSAGDVISTPGGTTIEVAQGQTFLLRHELKFDKAQKGYFALTITWTNWGREDENFTLENAPSVYWTASGLPVENVQWGDQYVNVGNTTPPTDGWKVMVWIPTENKIDNDGNFYVDIWLRACSSDGTPHRAGDHQLDYGAGIVIVEDILKVVSVDPVTIHVLGRGVDVSISPDNRSGVPCTTLDYTITVKNTGNMGSDNYELTVGDNAGWGGNLTLDNYLLRIPENENRTTTLHVHIPENAIGCTNDNITVTVTSRGNENVRDNASCTAHVEIVKRVNVSISPGYRSELAGSTLNYIVAIVNTSNVTDSYTLSVSDNENWGPGLSENQFNNIPPFENNERETTLTVTIPENAVPCTKDNIRIVATSQENENVRAENSCIAHAAIVRGVEVSISPGENEAENGQTVTFAVTVKNLSNVQENFQLAEGDNARWTLALDNNWLLVPKGENRTTKLTVTIPENARGCTWDNIWVKATSKDNVAVFDNKSCLAHVAVVRGVDISISPSYQAAMHGSTVNYTVTIRNTGNVQENYILTKSDDKGWGDNVALDDNWLIVLPGENRNTTLRVTIPDEAIPCTHDNITVTATSKDNTAIEDNDSCIAHAVPWEGTAMFKLETAYKVSLEKDLWLYTGSKLVAKFYAADNTPQTESVIHSFTPPYQVKENENVPHPQGKMVGIVRLALTTVNTANEISTIASFIVRRDDFGNRIIWIIMNYTGGTQSQKDAWGTEIIDIVMNYTSYPS